MAHLTHIKSLSEQMSDNLADPAASSSGSGPGAVPEVAPISKTASRGHFNGPDGLVSAFDKPLGLSSLGVHADDYMNSSRAVAPPLHLSTTFRYTDNPDDLEAGAFGGGGNFDPNAPHDSHVYSRESAPNTTRLEAVLTSLLGGPSITYSSGLAAFHALIVFLNPKRVAIGGGYHGCHGVLELVSKLTGLEILELSDPSALDKLQKGDVVHVETPLNPTGEARDLAAYAKLAREKGCVLTCDATFAPPPLMQPFELGVDVVLHSGTKYFGGHSDMLCGVLAVSPERAKEDWAKKLKHERVFLGSVMGNMEGWLGVRSLRTLEIRVERQSHSADKLVEWLAAEVGKSGSDVAGMVEKVHHASLQEEAKVEGSWLRKQMPRGYGPVFAMTMKSEEAAKRLPSKLMLFHHATSLGGVESLIEWRAMSDKSVDRKLVRVSVGVEGWEDLKADLEAGFRALAEKS